MARSPGPRVASAAILVAACQTQLSAPQGNGQYAPPRLGGTLHLASAVDLRSLDPAASPDALSRQAELLLFSGLVDFDDDANVVPDLADSWEVRDGGREYLFHLHQHVLFHDGAELSADDVKRSIERSLDPKTPNPFATRFSGLVGYDAFVKRESDSIAGVLVRGRYAVSFLLAAPDASFLGTLALTSARPVCASAGHKFDDGWTPCGTGPFYLPPGGWTRGVSLDLRRSPSYFKADRAWLDAVHWTFNVAVLPQRFMFERGELDVLEEMTQADAERFRQDPRWAPFGQVGAEMGIHGEAMNTELAPFDNVEVRRAVAAAIDRVAFHLVKPTNVEPATGPLIRGVAGFERAPTGQRYDYAAALEHMRLAGFPFDPKTGKGGYPQTVQYVVPARSLEEANAQILAQQLAKIGLRIEIRSMNWGAFLSTTARRGQVAISPHGWDLDTSDPSGIFDPLFSTDAISDDGSSNYAFYSNRRLDELLRLARAEQSPRLREEKYNEASEIVTDDAPWAFTWSSHSYIVHQPRVRGLHSHPIWQTEVTGVWLAEERGTTSEVRP